MHQNILLFRIILPFLLFGFSEIINYAMNFVMMNIIINIFKKCQGFVNIDDSSSSNTQLMIARPSSYYNSVNNCADTNQTICSVHSDSICDNNYAIYIDRDLCNNMTTTSNICRC